MRAMIVFMCVGLMHVSADVRSQFAPINMDLKDVTVGEAVRILEKQLNQNFFYSRQEVDAARKLDVRLRDAGLDEFVRIVFGSNFKYRIQDDIIIISPVEQAPQQQAARRVMFRGRVFDHKNQPMTGATLVVRGSNIGTVTDPDGRFSLSVPDVSTTVIEVRFIGMELREIRWADINDQAVRRGEKEYVIKMQESVSKIDDVVVTGIANLNKNTFTADYTVVTREQILQVSPRNVLDALYVFEPSLRTVTNNEMGSDPNTLPEMYLRGRSGVDMVSELDKYELTQADVTTGDLSRFALQNNPNTPLFVMDGFETTLQIVFDLDPHRVKSITILKDAAATAMYGSKAANGVIVIETMPPQPGAVNISYSFNGTFEFPDLTGYDLMNSVEKLRAELLSGVWDFSNAYEYTKLAELMNYVTSGVNTDWIAQPLRNGFSQNHSVNFSGGSEEFRFSAGLSYGNNSGVMKESYRNNFSGNFLLSYRVGAVEFTNNVSYSSMNNQDSPWGNFNEYYSMLPYNKIRDDDGNILPTVNFPKHMNTPNPIYGTTLNNFSRSKYYNIQDNFNINWYITDNLTLRGSFSILQNESDSRSFKDPEDPSFSKTGLILDPRDWGSLTTTKVSSSSWDANINLAYNKQIGDHGFFMQGTMQLQESKSSSISTKYIGFPSGELNKEGHANRIDGSKPGHFDNNTRNVGLLALLNYSYKSIYNMDASVRCDGSSEFGAKKRWGTFWSFGASLNLHNYDWVKSLKVIDQLRLRGTFGYTGKTNYPAYAARDILSVDFSEWYSTGLGSLLMAMGNQNLVWEKTAQTNLGLDVTLFRKLSLSFSWYNKYTTDMITDVTIQSSSGFTSYKDNAGEMRNRGYEASFNLRVYDSRDFNVSVFANFAHNDNKLMKLSDAMRAYNERVDDYYKDYARDKTNSKYATPFRRYEEGGSMSALYGMKSMGINPADGKEAYLDRNGNITGIWAASQQQIIGDTEPAVAGAFGINFRYRNLSLFTAFSYKWGGQVYNSTLAGMVENANLSTYNADKRVLSDRWQNPGDVTPLKDIADRSLVTQPTSRFVQDDNELRFTSVSLSYDFDTAWSRKLGIERLRFNVSTNDLGVFSTIRQERGTSYPFARSFNFGLSANF